MDWKGAIEEERAALMRVVALLNALAGLAELAASRSPAVRGFVLWVLRRAEAVALDFVAGGPNAPIVSLPVGQVGARPADAMRLAASLRRLALQLERQARKLATCGARCTGTKPPLCVMPAMPAMRDGANALSMLAAFSWLIPRPAPDTS
jgi:hypothetical protein